MIYFGRVKMIVGCKSRSEEEMEDIFCDKVTASMEMAQQEE